MSEEESIFSDASQSDVGSIFSDGGSSCDESYESGNYRQVNIQHKSDIAPAACTTDSVASEQPIVAKIQDIDCGSTVDDSLESSEVAGLMTSEIASTEEMINEPVKTSRFKQRSRSLNDSVSKSRDENLKTPPAVRKSRAFTNAENKNDQRRSSEEFKTRNFRKATTPIRKKIQTLQSCVETFQNLQPVSNKQNSKSKLWQERKHVLKDINNRRKALLNHSWDSSVDKVGSRDGSVNVFEMTMAEEDREDQKRRHQMSRQKFENLL